MGWRESFFKHVGPGMFSGATFGAWLSALEANRFRVAPRSWLKAGVSTALSLSTSLGRLTEEAFVGQRVRALSVEKPIFVLGHWRSGTTHLQNLFSVDERFAYPQFLDTMSPHTFLTSGALVSNTFGRMIPSTRFELDNIPFKAEAPYEDEFALAIMTGLSPYLSWAFPEHAERYDRYVTLDDAPAAERRLWAEAMMLFARKVTYKYGKRMVFKSPPHTARIRMLLELFPDAKFVHIHRHPFSVYRSTKHLQSNSRQYFSMQQREYDDHERILSMYGKMYEAYFEQKKLIPAGCFAEVAYDDLESDPTGQLGRIYEELDLPDFSEARPAVERYIASLGTYEKGNHAPLSEPVRREIAARWRRTFEEWNYSTTVIGRKTAKIARIRNVAAMPRPAEAASSIRNLAPGTRSAAR
ncbi:MAG: sulfotransferase [Planctomycetia bacterium]|nr:sulfotransferase [Planctomycetia bacterium]